MPAWFDVVRLSLFTFVSFPCAFVILSNSCSCNRKLSAAHPAEPWMLKLAMRTRLVFSSLAPICILSSSKRFQRASRLNALCSVAFLKVVP